MSDWEMTRAIPETPGYYWVLRERDGERWVHDAPLLVRDDGGACWLPDAIGHQRIERPCPRCAMEAMGI